MRDDEAKQKTASSSESLESSDEEELVITQLVSAARNKERVNVFVNNRYTLSLDVKQVVDLNVKQGQRITAAELQKLHEASEFGKLYKRALEWALTRPHSVHEARTYLKYRQLRRLQLNQRRIKEELQPLPEIQDSAIELVIERLSERGYVDDKVFAKFYVENRFLKKGISKRRLQQELQNKRVPDDIINQILENSPRNEAVELRKMIAKKYKKYEYQKLVAYLTRQGFNYQLVKDAIREYEQEEGLR